MFEGLFQPMHLLIVLGIVLLLYGPKKLPELGKGLGESIRGFKQGFNEEEERKPTRLAQGEQPDKPSQPGH